MKVTISDVAREAGVSKSTVSKAMNGHPSIPESTRARIRQTVERLGFTPNSSARSLASRSTRNLTLLFDISRKRCFSDPFFLSILNGIEEVAFQEDFEITLCNVNRLGSNDAFLSRYVFNRRADGIFIPGAILSSTIINELRKRNFPYVIIGQPYEFAYSSWTDLDNGVGAELLVEHMVEKGYRSPAFIAGPADGPIARQRAEGFTRALKRLGLGPSTKRILYGNADRVHGLDATSRLLSSPEAPDCFLCEDNFVATGVYAAVAQAGLKIGPDIGVAAFNDYPLAPYMEPPLTVADMDTYELGVSACRLLIEALENPSAPQKVTLLKPGLIARESTSGKA